MKNIWKIFVIVLIAALLAACAPAAKPEAAASGVTQVGKIGGSDRADQDYVWISQYSSLPLFVERVYPALDAFARDYGVTVRKAGPTTVDLAAFIATVEQECAGKPAGVIVVGGWDPALTEPVNKCIDAKVPLVVTDGDLPQSKRLSYVGTDWYNLGVVMAKFQMSEHEKRGLKSGEIAILSPIQAENMQAARKGFKDTVAGSGYEVVSEEDNESSAEVSAQKVKAILAANPNLSGVVGLDSESGPGIIAALDEAGKTGKLVVTTNEGGREYLNNLIEDKIQLVVMEKYDVMDYTALFMLYSWHNNAIKPGGLDPWVSNWMPNKIDSGLLQITKDNAADVMKAMEEAEKASK